MSCARHAVVFALSALLSVPLAFESDAWAQDKKEKSDPPPQRAKEGDYGGVSPDKLPKKGEAPSRRPKKPSVTWIGFQAGDEESASKIFVQLSHKSSFRQVVSGKELLVAVSGVQLRAPNARLPIYTDFFPTMVGSIVAKRSGGDVVLRMTFKDEKPQNLEAEINKGPDGFYYLMMVAP